MLCIPVTPLSPVCSVGAAIVATVSSPFHLLQHAFFPKAAMLTVVRLMLVCNLICSNSTAHALPSDATVSQRFQTIFAVDSIAVLSIWHK